MNKEKNFRMRFQQASIQNTGNKWKISGCKNVKLDKLFLED